MSDILEKLKKWETLGRELNKQFDELNNIIGFIPGSPFFNTIFEIMDEYTKELAELYKDEGKFLDWYRNECNFGLKPLHAYREYGTEVLVDSVEKLEQFL